MEMLSIATQKGINVYAIKGNWRLDGTLQSKIVATVGEARSEARQVARIDHRYAQQFVNPYEGCRKVERSTPG